MQSDTAMQVGDPKFLFPVSEKAWDVSFLSLVHRTTSQGGDEVSVSPAFEESTMKVLLSEALRLWADRKAGDDGRWESRLGEAMRDWKRRSKGRKEGVGLPRPGREGMERRRLLLLGEEMTEPCGFPGQ